MKVQNHFFLSTIILFTVCFFSTSATAQQVSDKEIKTNINPVANSLSYINRLKPVVYEYNQSSFKQLNLPAGKQMGFIADDVQQVLPMAVSQQNKWYTTGKNNQRAITTQQTDLEKLVPVLVGAVQEQQVEIEKLKAELQQLKARK